MINILKSLSDQNRLRILSLLNLAKSSCACNIEHALELNQSNVSRHISKLKSDQLITTKKQGKWCYYSLNTKILNKYSFIEILLNEIPKEIIESDYEKFLNLKNSQHSCNSYEVGEL